MNIGTYGNSPIEEMLTLSPMFVVTSAESATRNAVVNGFSVTCATSGITTRQFNSLIFSELELRNLTRLWN